MLVKQKKTCQFACACRAGQSVANMTPDRPREFSPSGLVCVDLNPPSDESAIPHTGEIQRRLHSDVITPPRVASSRRDRGVRMACGGFTYGRAQIRSTSKIGGRLANRTGFKRAEPLASR